MNYQLARTNTYLSGQLKLDLTLNKNKGDLCVEDVHLSPVSSYTGFGWGNDPDDLLDGRHIENIKNFYSKTSNIFYEECLNPALISEYPIYSPNFVIDTHNNDNKMGLYRVPIRTYKKPYAFFCPFWITDPSKFLGTRFKFTFYKYININPLTDYINEADAQTNEEEYPQEKFKISSIYLPMRELADTVTHNKFVKYFNEYLNGFSSHKYDIKADKFLTSNVVSNAFKVNAQTDLSNVVIESTENNSTTANTTDTNNIPNIQLIKFKPTGTLTANNAEDILRYRQVSQKPTNIEKEIEKPFLSDDLVYLSFKEKRGWVKGIDPQAGTYVNKDISYLCQTLLQKERPLMDNDYYLARIFKDNTVIAQQLINFNFIFDIADIIPHIVYEELQYCRFGIEVEIEQPIGETKEEIEESLKNGVFETLQLKDFYSNYEFIPNTYIISKENDIQVTYNTDTIGEEYLQEVDKKFSENRLDYKKNADFIQYVYKNKLEQNIVHWSIGNSNYIFNLYDGFTPIVIDKTQDVELYPNKAVYKSGGDMPFSPNIAINKFNASKQTPLWAKITLYGTPNIQLMSNIQKYFTNFNINTEWIEGVKYDFSNIDYNAIIADLTRLGISDINTQNAVNSYLNGKIWVKVTPINTSSTDENSIQFTVQDYGEYIFITVSENIKYLSFVYVMRALKNNLFPSDFKPLNISASQYIKDKPIELAQESTTKLTKLAPSNVRFVGVTPIFRPSELTPHDSEQLVKATVETLHPENTTTLTPTLRGRIVDDNEINITDVGFKYSRNDLEDYIRAQRTENYFTAILSPISYNDIIEYTACVNYNDQTNDDDNDDGHGEVVQFKALSKTQRLNIIGQYFLYWFMKQAIIPSAISFNSTYNTIIAESPANDSTEVDFTISKLNLLKKNILYRYDGKLQPMLITVDDKTDEKNTEKNLINYSNYIVQYEESLQSIPAFNIYNNTKYLPKYPSVGYCSVASEVIDYNHSAPIQYYGDKSHNIYRGERKWYNGSFIYFLPRKIEMSIVSTEYNENTVFSGFVNEILTNMGLTEPEVTINTTEVEIQEYIRNNIDFVMNYILPLYNYDSKCSIKYREDTEAKNIPELDENNQIKYIYNVIFELI